MKVTVDKKYEIEILNLFKSFGDKVILRGVNIKLEKGSSLAVIGPSGTGKSVLLKCLIGLDKIDSGTIKINGRDITKVPAFHKDHITKGVGMLFQGSALFDSLTVQDNILFGLDRKQCENSGKKVEKLLKIVGLDKSVSSLFPSELSGGMQKRVSLARTIAKEPEIVLFDEPTTGLDPITSNIITELICKTIQEFNITSIVVTHDINALKKVSKQVVLLYRGNIVWEGQTKEINSSENIYIKQFINGLIKGPIK